MLFRCLWVNTELVVCVESAGHVIVSGDNLASGCFDLSYIIFNYSSLIDVGIEAFTVSFAQSGTMILLRLACFTALLTSCLTVRY